MVTQFKVQMFLYTDASLEMRLIDACAFSETSYYKHNLWPRNNLKNVCFYKD